MNCWRENLRDLNRKGYNSNNPIKSYFKLLEHVEKLESRLRQLDQLLVDGMVRVSELEDRKGVN